MIKGRRDHACAMRGKEVFVIGGEMSTRSSLEIWNGKDWSYIRVPIGATYLKLISQGRNLFLFGGWEDGKLGNTIWKINHQKEFIEAGNTAMARTNYAMFTLPHGFLTNCQGVNCGSYGKATSCGSCAIIYPKASCFGDCGWVLNKTTQEYDCVDRGNDNIHLNRRRHPYICFSL